MAYNWEQTDPGAELTGEQEARLSALRQSNNYPTPQQMAYTLEDTQPEDRQALLDYYRELSILNGDPLCIVDRLTGSSAYLRPSTHTRQVDEGDGIVQLRGVCEYHATATPPGPIVIRQ